MTRTPHIVLEIVLPSKTTDHRALKVESLAGVVHVPLGLVGVVVRRPKAHGAREVTRNNYKHGEAKYFQGASNIEESRYRGVLCDPDVSKSSPQQLRSCPLASIVTS